MRQRFWVCESVVLLLGMSIKAMVLVEETFWVVEVGGVDGRKLL